MLPALLLAASTGWVGVSVRRPASRSACHMKQATPQASLAGAAVQPRTPLVIRYHDDWYDMSGWRVAHPAGAHWIDGFRDADATEVIDAFHSDEGKAILARLPKAKAPPSNLPPEVTPLTRSFRALRQQLLDEGWWRRDARCEILALAPCLTLLVAGTTVARTAPLLATVLLGLASTSAGWLGHDYIHGRGRLCTWLRGFGGLINGHSSFWWSNKVTQLTSHFTCPRLSLSSFFFTKASLPACPPPILSPSAQPAPRVHKRDRSGRGHHERSVLLPLGA